MVMMDMWMVVMSRSVSMLGPFDSRRSACAVSQVQVLSQIVILEALVLLQTTRARSNHLKTVQTTHAGVSVEALLRKWTAS